MDNEHIFDWIPNRIFIINHKLLHDINSGQRKFHRNKLSDIQQWLSDQEPCKECHIPHNIVQFSNENNTNTSYIVCAIEHKDSLVGIVAFDWGKNDIFYNYILESNGLDCVRANEIFKSNLNHPMSIANVRVDNASGIRYIQRISKSFITQNDNNPNLIYQPSELHNIGFVKQEIDPTITEDYKELTSFCGHAGASTGSPCVVCITTKTVLTKEPTIDNRQEAPRHYENVLQCAVEATKYHNNDTPKPKSPWISTEGICGNPMSLYYPNTLGFAFMHNESGFIKRLVFATKGRIFNVGEKHQDLFDEYNNCDHKLFEIRSQIQMNQNLLKQLQDQNTECKQQIEIVPDV